MSKTSIPSTQSLPDFFGKFQSRKLLLHDPLSLQPTTAPTPDSSPLESFEYSNVVMILSVLICSLIFSLGMNALIKCVLRCAAGDSSSESESSPNSSIKPANVGLPRKALKTFPVVKYSLEPKLPGLCSECVICLSEFAVGDSVRLLPKCNHGFHVRCIDKWLRLHSSCPICRHCLIDTCHKILDCTLQDGLPAAPVSVEDVRITIVPNQPST